MHTTPTTAPPLELATPATWPQVTGPTSTPTTAPPPVTTTSTTVAPPPLPVGDVEQAIARWFPGDLYVRAKQIASCESQLNPRAYNSSGSAGLFQIHGPSWSSTFAEVTGVAWSDGWFVADLNARFARWLFDHSGWSPWVCDRLV